MTELNWDKINVDNSKVKSKNSSNDGDRRSLKYITLGKKAVGKEYIVRPIKNPVGFYKAVIQTPDGRWNNVVVEMDDEGGDTHVRNHPLYLNHNVPFSARYAINVIDRADGEVKILEGGVSIFEAFSKFNEMTERSPGAKEGADFKIEVTGKKGKDYYKVNMHAKTVLGADEVDQIKEQGGIYKLQDIYKPTPDEKWKKLVAQLDGGEEQNSPSEPAREPVAAAATSSDTGGDDLDGELDGDDLPFV